MQNESGTKIKYLKIWDILRQETDAEHPMKTPDLLERLNDLGIHCDRRTLYRNIDELNEWGYEINVAKIRNVNAYYVEDSSFDIPEIHILMDAVQAASFIPEKKTKLLVDKIATLAGGFRAEVLKHNTVEFNTTKNTNESIFYIVNEIAVAIDSQRKIEFSYFDYDLNHKRVYRKGNKRYVVNPYATVFSNDKYYLLCYDDKHGNMGHYRIDRMDSVLVLEDPIAPLKTPTGFDVKKHKRQVFGMFVGNEERVSFKAKNTLIDTVFDTFGEKTLLYRIDDESFGFSAEVQVSRAFLAWCCSFGDDLVVTQPPIVVDEVKRYIDKLIAFYSNVIKQCN